jgi:hypothetical protein
VRTSRRDQARTGFTRPLEIVAKEPGVRAAVLVDGDGETVDWSGSIDGFEARIAAAHLRLLLAEASSFRALGRHRTLVVRADAATFAVHALEEGYALVLVLRRRRSISASALSAFEHAVAAEAGWATPLDAVPRHRAVVETCAGSPRRPARVQVAGRWVDATVLGHRAPDTWRVRLETGVETTLLRTSRRSWWSQDALADLVALTPTPPAPGVAFEKSSSPTLIRVDSMGPGA